MPNNNPQAFANVNSTPPMRFSPADNRNSSSRASLFSSGNMTGTNFNGNQDSEPSSTINSDPFKSSDGFKSKHPNRRTSRRMIDMHPGNPTLPSP